ncbi:ParB/RepB/Spo0J family partition protein [Streptomyces sp. WG7]|uniref:ParB/RepB/Spo0J family partition protein n=1 Tax=Streptomyces sp. WG7 TaxID=3417650 RepID=UPI003CE89777
MSKKPGLSRNLAAERAARRAATQQARLVPQGLPTVHPDRLMPSPENGRKKLHKIDELAETLRTDGMNTAMTVLPPDVYVSIYPQHKAAVEARVAEGVLFVVHHGHRRLAAAKLAGLTEVPILVRSDVPSLRIAAIQENVQRMGLNPMEEATEFQEALHEKDERGKQLSQRELAKRVGCSQTYVSHRVALLRLVPALQQAVIDHWLKEQQLLEEGADTSDGPGRLKLPVREAATVYARLRPDLQDAFARGEISAEQAVADSKVPPAEQQIRDEPAEDADCAATTESSDAANTSLDHLPEQRTECAGEDRERSDPPQDAPPRGRADDERSATGTDARTETMTATSTVTEDPRGVIVVRTVEDLARNISELLSQDEIEELKRHLSA